MYLQFKRIALITTLLTVHIMQPCIAETMSHNDGVLHYLNQGKIDVQFGLFNAFQGKSQNIAINSLIGDRYSVTSHNDQNMLLGIGYFIDGADTNNVHLKYGINAFYLANTTVKGNVIQEMQFSNLSYNYDVTNYPIYIAFKSIFKTNQDIYSFSLDLGAGPNIIKTSNVSEDSLDGGITKPDHIFSGNTTMAFSAMAGVGIKFNQIKVFHHSPLECGYRFFYLGQGEFDKLSGQVKSTLNTGDSYANAVMCSVAI